MNFSSKLRRTIVCLPFILAGADRLDAAPALLAGQAGGAQRVGVSVAELERCGETEVSIDQARWRIACDRLVAAPGVRYWDGHVADAPDHKLSLQIRPEGVSGLLDLPGRPLRLGVVDGTQWLLDTPAQELRAQIGQTAPPLFVLREDTHPAARPASGTSDRDPAAASTDAMAVPAGVSYPVNLNLADLAAVEPGGQVDLALPGLQQRITYEKTVVSPTGVSTWVGYLSDYGRDYPVVLTYGTDGSTTGSIQGPAGEWLVTGSPGATRLVDTHGSGIVHNPGAKDDDALPPPSSAGIAVAAEAAASTGTTATATATAADATSTNTVIDVLVLYTPGLATRYGGQSGAATRIDHFISLANQAYGNGNVGITLRRVGLQQLDIADNTTNSSMLDQLRRASGAFAGIPALRNSTGADGVLLVRPFDMAGQGGNCGVGYIGGYGGSPMSAYADLAYAVVSEGSDTKGQPYYCTDTTFAHELGHNMGLMHDRATVANQGGGSGALPYAFGYGKSGQFGTVMSYIHPVVVRFSNPLDSGCNNGPCGIDAADAQNSADNARALGITRSPFSAFRATTTATSVSIAGIVTIDGKVAANVKILADGTQCALTGSTGAYSCSFAAGWSGTLSASASNVNFTPPSQSYAGLAQSTSRNFAGLTRTVSVSGTATVGGKPASGVTVSAGSATCGTTGSTGAFACGVSYGWSGTISATSASATFAPVALTSVTANRTVQLAGTPKPVSVAIKGTVRVNGAATAGVTISANNVACAVTTAAGTYSCSVPAKSNGVLKAAYPGTTFSPTSRAYSNITSAIVQNFEGTRPQISISGSVKAGGVYRAGVAVQAGGTACGVTNASGEFSCARPKGWSGTIAAPALPAASRVNVVNLSLPIRVALTQP